MVDYTIFYDKHMHGMAKQLAIIIIRSYYYFLRTKSGCLCSEDCQDEYSKYIMPSPPDKAAMESERLLPPAYCK